MVLAKIYATMITVILVA